MNVRFRMIVRFRINVRFSMNLWLKLPCLFELVKHSFGDFVAVLNTHRGQEPLELCPSKIQIAC